MKITDNLEVSDKNLLEKNKQNILNNFKSGYGLELYLHLCKIFVNHGFKNELAILCVFLSSDFRMSKKTDHFFNRILSSFDFNLNKNTLITIEKDLEQTNNSLDSLIPIACTRLKREMKEKINLLKPFYTDNKIVLPKKCITEDIKCLLAVYDISNLNELLQNTDIENLNNKAFLMFKMIINLSGKKKIFVILFFLIYSNVTLSYYKSLY